MIWYTVLLATSTCNRGVSCDLAESYSAIIIRSGDPFGTHEHAHDNDGT